MTTARVIRLTSPAMRGNDVKALQRALAGENAWNKNFRPGAIDGIYGPGTAGAVSRAKHYMGYAMGQLSGDAVGPMVMRYLTGKTKLPKLLASRRTFRLRAAKEAASKTKMRDVALKHALDAVGTKESPAGSNRVKYSVWYGLIGPWCAMFTSWCYVAAGSSAMYRGRRYAYVPYIKAATYDPKSGLTRTADPQPGDLVLFDWGRDGIEDHIGLFIRWTNKAAGEFEAVEGNTSYGNDSNGGAVMRRKRNKSTVDAFVKVHR